MESNGEVGGAGGATSPEMLRNTPFNIMRLSDEINHFEGRQKYLAHTKSPSDGGDVRWYFCKVPLAVNELAASVPLTEIVGKGDYFRFGMRDSLAIEAFFLQREDDLLSGWWKEYAECCEGPCGSSVTSKQTKEMLLESPVCGQLYATDEERVGVPVKGGLYEVDLIRRHCFPVYWNGENRRVLRGHWFGRKGGLDWLPLREDVSEQLEYAYRTKVWRRRTFQQSGLFAARVDLQGSTPGLHALFTGVDDTWEAWLSVDASGFSGVVGFGKNGTKLRRGYAPPQSQKPTQDELRQQQEEEMDDYCSQVPVRHLVFMVHGIGQRLEKSNLVDDVGDFRNVTARVAERHLTFHQLASQRVLYIPCQWRKGLTLGGEVAVEKITLDGVRGLRTMLSATVHDVLYYMSPIYCQEIIDSVSNQLNKLYLKFLKRNPGYDGKVSIYGHSLGSVLSYDILCHQETMYSPFPMEWMYKEHKRNDVPCPTRSDLTSSYNPISNFRDESSENIESESMIGLGDCPDLLEEPVEGNGNPPLGPPASSESDLSSTIDIGYQKTNDASLLEGNINEPFHNSDDMDSYKSDLIIDPNNMRNDVVQCDDSTADRNVFDNSRADGDVSDSTADRNVSDSGKADGDVSDCKADRDVSDDIKADGDVSDSKADRDVSDDSKADGDVSDSIADRDVSDDSKADKEVSDNCKAETIKLLMEEIDMLKAKVKELDGECAGKVNAKKSTAVDQTDPERVQPEGRDFLKSYTPQIRYTKLQFKVDTFFAVGSPLGVFLSLRNVRIGIGKGKDYWKEGNINEEMPACRQMLNIFHPFDPVAYRLEPLACKEFIDKPPVIIPYHRGGKRLYVVFKEFKEGLASYSRALRHNLSTIRVKVLTLCDSNLNDERDEQSENTQEKEERSYGSIMMDRLTGSIDGRIDHVLQDKTLRHPYVSAIGAHTNYWRDLDTALFMLRHLYKDIPEEPSLHSEQQEGSSQDEKSSKGWCDPREVAEEELPLTFADGVFLKHFSYKVKRAMRK